MDNNRIINFRYPNRVILFVLASLYILGLYVFILSYKTPYFEIPVSLGFIELLSLFLYLISFLMGSRGLKWYFIFLIFNIIAMPASIDNLSPSVIISSFRDNREVFFPLITHIDLYLIFGILKYWKKDKIFYSSTYFFVLGASMLLLVSSIFYNIFSINKLYDTGLIVAYSFHVRYILLFLVLFINTDILLFKKSIHIGLLISLLFLMFEAIIYSKFYLNSPRIISGTLGNNSYANFLSAVSCFYIYLITRNKISKRYILMVFFMALIIFLTKTRSALFILLAYLFIEVIIYFRKLIVLKQLKNSILLFCFVLLAVTTLLVVLSENNRLNFKNFSINKIDISKENLTDIIVLDENDFTASLNLRLNHYQTSLNMINENPWFGIGPGRWNVYKANYESKDTNVMDSHNDVLAMASQYGLIPGITLCLCIFLLPFYIHKKKIKKNKSNNAIEYLFIINLVMVFAGITNAGLFKHQIFGFLALILIVFISNKNEKDINSI